MITYADPNENPPDGWEECGGCGCWHPADFAGDCRDDSNRWPFRLCSVCKRQFVTLSGGVMGCPVHGIRRALDRSSIKSMAGAVKAALEEVEPDTCANCGVEYTDGDSEDDYCSECRQERIIMQAITTKYFGPTNCRGARIKATSGSGQSVTISYCYEMDAPRAHREAAIALCRKLGWSTNLLQGGTADGYAFVFAPEGK